MKDAAGIAQVDAIIAAEHAAQDALQEILNDPVCKATPAQIKTQLEQDAAQVQADINAATNIATAKTRYDHYDQSYSMRYSTNPLNACSFVTEVVSDTRCCLCYFHCGSESGGDAVTLLLREATAIGWPTTP